MLCSVFIAVSLDGFIARADDSVTSSQASLDVDERNFPVEGRDCGSVDGGRVALGNDAIGLQLVESGRELFQER